MTDIELGEVYDPDELPDNDMNQSGKVEMVNDDTFVVAVNGVTYEFEMMLRCKAIGEVDERGGHYYREHLYEPVGGKDD